MSYHDEKQFDLLLCVRCRDSERLVSRTLYYHVRPQLGVEDDAKRARYSSHEPRPAPAAGSTHRTPGPASTAGSTHRTPRAAVI